MLNDVTARAEVKGSESSWSSCRPRWEDERRSSVLCGLPWLNFITNKDCFPLPRIDGTLDMQACGAKWFKRQVALHPGDEDKTEFSTGRLL
jgi:hypothetical protein